MYKSKDIQENSLFVLNLDSDQFPINGLFGTLKLVFVHISHWQLPVLTVQGLSGGEAQPHHRPWDRASVVSCIQWPLPSIVNFVLTLSKPRPPLASPLLSLCPLGCRCLQLLLPLVASRGECHHVTRDTQHFLPRCSTLLPPPACVSDIIVRQKMV